jgi:post-segregation antitoxin (ccd killing protein)
MARVNVYLPDELAARAREKGLNVSAVTRSALEAELAGDAASEWLARAAALASVGVEHDEAIAALDVAREELSGDDRG